jgi:hypothetical protein
MRRVPDSTASEIEMVCTLSAQTSPCRQTQRTRVLADVEVTLGVRALQLGQEKEASLRLLCG